MACTTKCILLAIAVTSTCAYDSDIISDLVTPVTDERRALDIKTEQFWQPLLKSAKESGIERHYLVYAEVEAAISSSPPENEHVRNLLSQALVLLQRADEEVSRQASKSAELASQRLETAPSTEASFSFLTGGQNFLSLAIKRFVGGGKYSERVSRQVGQRQADVLPSLRGAAAQATNVLADCRAASRLGFDVMKYDIYEKQVPKTPAFVVAAANRLVDAAGDTRHLFLASVGGVADALAKDTKEKDADPSRLVTRALVEGLGPLGQTNTEDKNDGLLFNL